MSDASLEKRVLISKLPLPIIHSMLRVQSKTSRLPQIAHRICKAETLRGQAQVSNTDDQLQNHFRMLKFYSSELLTLGMAHGCIEGTHLNDKKADIIAEKLL